jgi:hypothetical protein
MAFLVLLAWPWLRWLVVERWQFSISGKAQMMMSQVDSSSSFAPFRVRNHQLIPLFSCSCSQEGGGHVCEVPGLGEEE